MRPPGNAADLLRTGQGERAAKQLREEPNGEIEHGRHFKEEREKEDRKQHDQPRGRIKQKISAEHPGNCAGSAERGQSGIGICQDLSKSRDRSADKIEDRKPHRSHAILDIVAENPEGPHIGEDVQPAAMQKLVR